MRKSLPLILGIVLSLGLLTHAFASGVGLPTIGSRAVNLGGAYRALSGDWSAGYWNPAGLTRVQGWNLGLNATTIIPYAKVQPAPYEGRSFYGYTTNEVETKPKTFFIPTFGVVNSPNEKFSWGFALYIPFGLGATWDIWNPVPGFNNKYDYPEEEYESDLKVLDFHLSGAYKLTDNFSVGLGAGLIYTDILIRQPTLSKPFADTPQLQPLLPLIRAPYDVMVTDQTLEGTGMGLSLNAGFIYDINEQWSLGASVRYYSDVNIAGEVTAYNYYPNDPTTLATLQQLLPAENYAQIQPLLSGEKQLFVDDDDAEATMPLPINAGIGIAYKPTDRLLFAFDTEWTQWSSWDAIPLEKIEAIDQSDRSTELIQNWDDALRFNFGTEYIAMRNNDSELALRLGYYHETNPVPDETIAPTIPDVNNRDEIIIGGGYTLGNITMNLAYVHIFIKERDVPEWDVQQNPWAVENVAGIYNAFVNEFHVGLEYNF